jgi:hypothetical protein
MMINTSLEQARVTPAQAETAIHYLAAVNHHEWAQWAEIAMPIIERKPDASVPDVLFAMKLGGLADVMKNSASLVTTLTERAVGGFAYRSPDTQPIIAHKNTQLTSWLKSATTNFEAKRTQRLLQLRLPFLDLSPEDQALDYKQAAKDFEIIAAEGGLVLPEPMPQVGPRSARHNSMIRSRHILGIHGGYLVEEAGVFRRACIACNATRKIYPEI